MASFFLKRVEDHLFSVFHSFFRSDGNRCVLIVLSWLFPPAQIKVVDPSPPGFFHHTLIEESFFSPFEKETLMPSLFSPPFFQSNFFFGNTSVTYLSFLDRKVEAVSILWTFPLPFPDNFFGKECLSHFFARDAATPPPAASPFLTGGAPSFPLPAREHFPSPFRRVEESVGEQSNPEAYTSPQTGVRSLSTLQRLPFFFPPIRQRRMACDPKILPSRR